MLHFIQWSELANPCGPIINIIIIYSRHTAILPLKFMHKQPHSTHRSQQSCPGRCAIQFNSHFTFMNRLQNRVQPHENRSAFIYIVYRHYKSDYDNRYGLCIRAPRRSPSSLAQLLFNCFNFMELYSECAMILISGIDR